jgi:hypothetical protein
MKTILGILLIAAPMGAQTALAPPQIGFVADANRSLRPLLGIAGNFVLGDSLADEVSDVASSGAFALVKTNSAVTVLDSAGVALFTLDTDPGRAVFAFAADGQPSRAWLPSQGLLLTWNADHFESQPVHPEVLAGQVESVAPGRFAVKRADGLWLVEIAADGSLAAQAALPGVAGPLLLAADGSLLYADGEALVVRGADGTERRIDTGAVISQMAPLSANWLRFVERHTRRQFAVCTAAGRERVLQLPEGASCCER